MYRLARPVLFGLDAEAAHHLTLAALRRAGRSPLIRALLRSLFDVSDVRLQVEAFGLRFRNPVGLAAGFDKDGVAAFGLAGLGFGHLEIGTLTRWPQPGNRRPRIFRYPAQAALVNRMGFPNAGIEALEPALAQRVASATARSGWSPPVQVGINLGKGKDTPLAMAADDYVTLLKHVHARRQASYVAINISSPNTPGLRELQTQAWLDDLLAAVAGARDVLEPRVPVLIKIAPDLDLAEVDSVLAAIEATGIDGVIATNTTLAREGVPEAANVEGGLSGGPLRSRSTEIIRYISRQTSGRLPIIGVGGILTAADALEKLRAGAHLIQIYTGLVYSGPGIVRQINRGLLRACQDEGLPGVSALTPFRQT
jgi:dihydroorotate dehydrogenase